MARRKRKVSLGEQQAYGAGSKRIRHDWSDLACTHKEQHIPLSVAQNVPRELFTEKVGLAKIQTRQEIRPETEG